LDWAVAVRLLVGCRPVLDLGEVNKDAHFSVIARPPDQSQTARERSRGPRTTTEPFTELGIGQTFYGHSCPSPDLRILLGPRNNPGPVQHGGGVKLVVCPSLHFHASDVRSVAGGPSYPDGSAGTIWTFNDSCWATVILFGWPALYWLVSHGMSGLLE
jgi:hypothetical protein